MKESGLTGGPPPFIYERAVNWGDTDSGYIVFTGRYLEYVVDAVEAWVTHTFGRNWFAMKLDEELGTPFRFANLDFIDQISPRDSLEIEIRVVDVGTTSLRFDIKGFALSKERGRRHCFDVDAMTVFLNTTTMKKTPIPPEYRLKLVEAGWLEAAGV